MKGTFTVYRSVYEALMAFPPEDMKEAFRMLGEYALDGKLPEDRDGVAYGLFCSIRPLTDRSNKKAEAGRLGGKAKGKQTESKHKAEERKVVAKEKEEKKSELTDTVIGYLNAKVGTRFNSKTDAYRKLVSARAKEGFTEQDFRTVIDKKAAEWKGTEWAKFLRPQTLFGTKFESYLNQQKGSWKGTNRFNNFEQSNTDWDAVAERIMQE